MKKRVTITQELLDNLAEKARLIRLHVIDMLTQSNSSHLGCSFSIVDILTVLYICFLNSELIKQKSPLRDYFILSKGHAAAGLYSTLAQAGFFPIDLLQTHHKNGSVLCGHPIKDSLPGIEASTGSLGHGLPIAVGLAIAAKHNKLSNTIYTLVGDGECQEGSIWEAVTMAVRFHLNNLVIIVDYNNLQGLDQTNNIMTGSFENKFKAFGCNVMSVDGHNYKDLITAFNNTAKTKSPDVIIAYTKKGKGVSFIEDKLEWHYKSFNPEQYKLAKQELENSQLKNTCKHYA